MNTYKPTPIGREIEENFSLIGAEILQENYSCTVDFKRELSKPYKTQLEKKGFEITHEKHSIYTLEL